MEESKLSFTYILEFQINPEAAEIISSLEGPIGICSVAGMYRTGKSYLLNRILLDRSNGFGVGPTINPCTKGLWLWSEPVQGTQPNGDPINVLVVDTEGLGAFDETQNHDVRIFTLAILLSSYFIYNSMGSIDESSLNQLSLVVNLTKNIQLKEQKSVDVDPEEYAKIFPSFMWVIRDFALQLQDENGASISQKEYLEGALKEQKGFSDAVEQKNRIRRLLKTFFIDRECCTMVRPVSNESELQTLASQSLDKLRIEFQDQVKVLRRKVLGRIKPKTLQGKQLSGAMIVNIASQYINSINNGAVPNIQSAWTYICQNECQKAVESSIKLFQDHIDKQTLPCDEINLNSCIEKSKALAIKNFKDKVLGDQIVENKKLLNSKLLEISLSKQKQNVKMSEDAMVNYLKEQFQPIEVSMHSGQFQNMNEFQQCIEQFLHYVENNSPSVSQTVKANVLKDFIAQVIIVAASQFYLALENKYRISTAIFEEQIKKQDANITQLKTDFNSQIDETRQMLIQSNKEKAELQGSEIHLKETLKLVEQSKLAQEEAQKKELEQIQSQYRFQIEQKDQQLQIKSESAAETQRQMMQTNSELQKQQALLTQQLQFLNLQISDKDRQFDLIQSEFLVKEKQAEQLLQTTTQELQMELLSLKKQLERTKETLSETKHKLVESNQKYETEKQELDELTSCLQKQLQSAQLTINDQTFQLKSIADDREAKVQELKLKLTHELREKEEVEQQLKAKMNDAQESCLVRIKELEKELAIAEQTQMFLKVENGQLHEQIQEKSASEDRILKALEQKANEQCQLNDQAISKYQELQSQNEALLENNLKNFEMIKHQLNQQLSEQIRINEDLQSKLQIAALDSDKQIQALQSQLNQCEKAKETLELQLKETDRCQLNLIESTKEHYEQQIRELEQEIELLEQQAEQRSQEVSEQAAFSFKNLKEMYEGEKQRQDQRLQDEKESNKLKLQQVCDEYELKLKEEQQTREEETDMLQQQASENEQGYLQSMKQFEFDNQMLQQRLQTYEEHTVETELRHEKEIKKYLKQLEQASDRCQLERNEWQTKQQESHKQIASKETEIQNLTQKYDALTNQFEKVQSVATQLQLKLQEETQRYSAKIDELKSKQQMIADDALKQKLDDVQSIALYKQKIDFQERKIEDLTKAYEESSQKYEQRLKMLKVETQQDFGEFQKSQILSRESLEQKFEQKRRKYKDQESGLNKRLLEIQKEKDLLGQQLISQQIACQQLAVNSEKETSLLQEKIIQLQDQLQSEREMLQSELDRIKQLLNDLEREHCDLQNTSEREKALLEGKCQFLEQQRDQAKNDYAEASRKFEMTIEQIQKRGSMDKDRTESNQSALLTQQEIKLKKQIQEQIDEKNRVVADLEEQIATYQKDQREVKIKLELCDRERLSLQKQLDQVLKESQQKELEFNQQLKQIQLDKDSKQTNYCKSLEITRETQKQKITEVELKFKESESRRQIMVFELEKERAKWAIEREQLCSIASEHIETIENLERQKESLMKDNEKLKTNKKSSFVLKTQAVAALKSPSRYQPQSNSFIQNPSIFIGGMSKLLQQQTGEDSESQRSLENANASMVLPVKSTENSQVSRTDNQSSLLKQGGAARKNVINFSMNRIKPQVMNNISNLTTIGENQQQL